MLKITKKVAQHVVCMAGCGRQNDYYCGIRAKNG